MSVSAVVVKRAPAYATIQDIGRRNHMSSGVPRSGAMDLAALLTLNAMLGNSADAACIESALTGGDFELTAASFAVGGADAEIRRNGESIDAYRVHRANAGDVVSIANVERGRFVYFAVAGGFDLPAVMSSRSTYAPGAFGGLEGRRLKNSDAIVIGTVGKQRRHHVTDALPSELRPSLQIDVIRFVERVPLDELIAGEWSVANASDRTGYRLTGNAITAGGSIVSEPVCSGVIQLPPGGEPIVLMADAPTVGGYRIAGTVISADIGALAQKNPGEKFSFLAVTVEAAQRELVARAEILERVKEWSLA